MNLLDWICIGIAAALVIVCIVLHLRISRWKKDIDGFGGFIIKKKTPTAMINPEEWESN